MIQGQGLQSIPLVSVVVTVYNKGAFIARTLESTLQQTYPNLEIIVVDDGSTDGSSEILQEAAARDPRLCLITQANAGVAAARNRGLGLARGQFVNILDGDDLLYPGFVEQTAAYLQGNPDVDIVHTSWDRVDDQDRKIGTSVAPDSDDYLRDLLLGNMFAPSAMMFRKGLLDRAGPVRDGLVPTEDWEHIIRCAKVGARFGRLPEVLAAYREAPNSARKLRGHQSNRFFPVIEMVFDGTMGPEYERLKDLSIIRHHFFLMQDYLKWGLKREAKEQFEKALAAIRQRGIAGPGDARYLTGFVPGLTLAQTARLSKALADSGAPRQAVKALGWRLLYSRRGKPARSVAKSVLRAAYSTARRSLARVDARIGRVRQATGYKDYALKQPVTILDIRRNTLDYLASMRLSRGGAFAGYRHSASTTKPVLYATLAALLLKHLYGVRDRQTAEEVEFVLHFQSEDGLFRDPVIACQAAETEDSWGWRHLTLHALMALGLYGVPARREIHYLECFADKDRFRHHLDTRDWGARVAWTSNELQNLGVMLQYARDYQGSSTAGPLLDILYEALDAHQDVQTGLYGHRFVTRMEISSGVQAGYHFWLLYSYDHRPVRRLERIIEGVLKTQNTLGGYGVQWNSSACEDIDSIDSLVRFGRLTDYRREDVQSSLRRALPAVLHDLNGDGGWVFRRHEALTVGHRQMFSAVNESNMFYTWFRTLGLAYCLSGLAEPPVELRYPWNFGHAPGHQFL